VPEKPKARDIQRYLAIASSMVGDDLEEGLLNFPAAAGSGPAGLASRRENRSDAVPTRDALKREAGSKVLKGLSQRDGAASARSDKK
jgi:hypothetical protein